MALSILPTSINTKCASNLSIDKSGDPMSLFKSIWYFLGKYQTPKVRVLHLLILVLVLTQIIISNWMVGTKSTTIPSISGEYIFTWMHICIGFSLFFLSFSLICICLKERGIKHFYPYLWGDIIQIKSDINQLIQLKLPDSAPRGLAATVQGLGLGALSIVIISGITWFFLWIQGASLAIEARSIHKSLTILIEIYIYGHGGLGIIHFIIWYKKTRK